MLPRMIRNVLSRILTSGHAARRPQRRLALEALEEREVPSAVYGLEGVNTLLKFESDAPGAPPLLAFDIVEILGRAGAVQMQRQTVDRARRRQPGTDLVEKEATRLGGDAPAGSRPGADDRRAAVPWPYTHNRCPSRWRHWRRRGSDRAQRR